MAQITVYKIKRAITDPDQIIVDRNKAKVKHFPVRVRGERAGDLYVQRVDRSRPPWLKLFEGSVDFDALNLRTASLAAVMLLQSEKDLFALTFGFGGSMLVEGCYERRFGLLSTLNAVDPAELRSIDHKRIEAVSRHTREQLSRAGSLDHFGLDIDRDLLRAVTGAPSDAKLGKRMSGADQLVVAGDIALKDLPTQLSKYATLSRSKKYRENFPWVDQVSPVNDPVEIDALTKRLAKELAAGSDKVWLSPPEVIDWTATDGFKYRDSKKYDTYPDLDLATYFVDCGDAEGLDDGRRLRSDRIYHVRTDTEGRHSWPVIRCLVAELDVGGDRFVLDDGMWYQVDRDFLKDVEAFVDGIPFATLDLPDAQSGQDEGAYNEKAWKRSKSTLHLLDKKLITFPKRGKIEVCDLYTKERVLVHVKKLRASSTLSHLFSQGVVSAQLLRDEPGFRKTFLGLIPGFEWGKSEDVIAPDSFEVCYAIICRKGRPFDLPLFSKMSLRAAAQTLRNLRFKVSKLAIPTV